MFEQLTGILSAAIGLLVYSALVMRVMSWGIPVLPVSGIVDYVTGRHFPGWQYRNRDQWTEYEVYQKRGQIAGNRTAAFISHRMSPCRFCDRILVFDRGQIVRAGSHEELPGDRNGEHYQLWKPQKQYYRQEKT